MRRDGFFASALDRAVRLRTALLAGLLLAALVLLAVGDAPRAETAAERLQRKLGQSTTGASKMSGQFPLLVPAAEFASVGGGTGSYAFPFSGGFIQAFDSSQPPKEVCLRAPVYLPDGAQVHSISAYVHDGDADANITRIELRRAPYSSTMGTLLMASTATSGRGDLKIEKLNEPVTQGSVVDNSQYSYLALVCMEGTGTSSKLRLYALAIEYATEFSYLPLIVNKH